MLLCPVHHSVCAFVILLADMLSQVLPCLFVCWVEGARLHTTAYVARVPAALSASICCLAEAPLANSWQPRCSPSLGVPLFQVIGQCYPGVSVSQERPDVMLQAAAQVGSAQPRVFSCM